MEHFVAAVDIGTTGAKGMIFDLEGEPRGAAYREYPCRYPKPGWVEQDADLLVRSAMEALKEAVEKAGLPSERIRALSLSAQRCCGIFLDEQEKQLRPMISWQDNRSGVEAEEIAAAIGPDAYYDKTGFPNSSTWLLSKMLWVRKNEPAVWSRTRRVVQMHDYFLRALGAEEYYVDWNDAGFYGVFDSQTGRWDRELLERFGLEEALLPLPAPSGAPAGRLSAQAAAACGLRPGTALLVGAGDQSAGALGAGVTAKGTLSISMGTAGAVTALLDSPFRDPLRSGMITCHPQKGFWLMEAYQAAAAGVYRWFRDEIAALEKAEAAAEGKDYYRAMEAKAAAVPAGAKGLLLLPYFAGAGTPRYNDNARGVLMGLTFAHDRACLARAYMEGITLDMKDMLNSFGESGIVIREVRLLGGPTKSPLWNQIQADVYGIPVSTLAVEDATLLGAAVIAAVGAGFFPTIREGAEKMVRIRETYRPDPANRRVYDDLYELFCLAYDGLDEKEVFQKLSAWQSGY